MPGLLRRLRRLRLLCAAAVAVLALRRGTHTHPQINPTPSNRQTPSKTPPQNPPTPPGRGAPQAPPPLPLPHHHLRHHRGWAAGLGLGGCPSLFWGAGGCEVCGRGGAGPPATPRPGVKAHTLPLWRAHPSQASAPSQPPPLIHTPNPPCTPTPPTPPFTPHPTQPPSTVDYYAVA